MRVSIPQGTINTARRRFWNKRGFLFPFRKVQLIRKSNRITSLLQYVSIPQGTINTGNRLPRW